jgi:hypothetical protein
LKRVAN